MAYAERARSAKIHTKAIHAASVWVVLLCAGCTNLKRCAYEGFGRENWQQPERVIAALAIEPGGRIADLGSGGGYFTFRLARAVGPAGKVYAVDIDGGMNRYVAEKAREANLSNVETVLARHDDPGLHDASVDLVFTCNTYHHIEDRSAYFGKLRRVLRPGGRVAIIDYDRGGWFARLFGHRTEPDAIRREMEEAGYRLDEEHDFLSRQSFVLFSVAD